MRETLKKEKGITLIALVITIIILLILAGVALATLTGNSGIIGNAEKAVGEYKDTAGKDQETINEIDKLLSDYLAKGTDDGTMPTISVTTNAIGQELQTEIKITVTAEAKNGKIVKIIMPDKTEKVIENPASTVTVEYIAKENGKYSFIAVDENGNKSNTCEVEINNVEYIGELHMYITGQDGIPLEGAGYGIYYKDINGDYIALKDEEGNDLIVLTDEEGKIDYSNLKYGEYGNLKEEANRTYYLLNKVAPSGYNLSIDYVEININSESENKIVELELTPGFVLPPTGKF